MALRNFPPLDRHYPKRFFAALALAVVLTPALTFAAERDGTTLFFSFEAIQQWLRQPTPADFFSTLMSWTRQGHGNQEGPIERNYRWGNGLGFDGYAYPGSRQPLWGY